MTSPKRPHIPPELLSALDQWNATRGDAYSFGIAIDGPAEHMPHAVIVVTKKNSKVREGRFVCAIVLSLWDMRIGIWTGEHALLNIGMFDRNEFSLDRIFVSHHARVWINEVLVPLVDEVVPVA